MKREDHPGIQCQDTLSWTEVQTSCFPPRSVHPFPFVAACGRYLLEDNKTVISH